ncbi:hypothetical protein ABEB36_002631 [Hypothenemus hampei]|uniref:Uncharacterized protein n=1 Tax=Hypothenemus hampei TaxID=57062 RepID=A0ABD1F9J9_HYPHA
MDNTKSEKQDVVRGRGKWRYIVVVATVLLIGTTLVPNLVLGFSRGEHDLFFERTSQGEPLMIFNGSDMAIWVKKDGMTKVCLYNYISALSYGLAGLWVPILLTKLDYSEISIVGCVIFLTGAALRIGINDFVKLCMCVGVLENVAIGLIMHASLIALNSNFTRKIALMTFLHETGVCVLGLFIYHIVSQMKGSPFFGVNPSILGIASIVLSFIAVFLLRTKKIIKDIRSVRPKNANANDGDCLIRNQIARNVSKGLGKGLTLWNNYRYWNTIIGISLVVNADEYFFKALPILNPMNHTNINFCTWSGQRQIGDLILLYTCRLRSNCSIYLRHQNR